MKSNLLSLFSLHDIFESTNSITTDLINCISPNIAMRNIYSFTAALLTPSTC